MSKEILIKIIKPESDEEIKNFKKFRIDLKALITKGKVKVVEKFRDFTFTITDASKEEHQKVADFIKKNNTVEYMHH